MSDPLDQLLEEFSEVTATARVRRPSLPRRRPPVLTALAASLVVLVLVGLVWLGISRHRRAQKKHAGLRVLR